MNRKFRYREAVSYWIIAHVATVVCSCVVFMCVMCVMCIIYVLLARMTGPILRTSIGKQLKLAMACLL